MSVFDPIGCIVMVFSLLVLACRQGGKTTKEDDDIDDYWTDG